MPHLGTKKKQLKNWPLIGLILFSVVSLGYYVVSSFAAGSFVAIEPELGTVTCGAIAVNNTSASGGKVVQFNNCSTPTPTAPPPTPTQSSSPWWHTNGMQILDGNNRQVFLRGVDDGRMTPGTGIPTAGIPDATEIRNLASWGFSFIRLGISWENLEPTAPSSQGPSLVHSWNQAYLTDIDGVVALARANGIRVVLDMHQAQGWSPKFGGNGLPSWLYPTQPACKTNSNCSSINTAHCEFLTNTAEAGVPIGPQDGLIATWRELASHYKNNSTVVGVDMFNEPQGCSIAGSARTYHLPNPSDNPIDNFYLHTGTAIRAINPNLLLIYEDDAYESYTKGGFALVQKLALPNAVYSMHYYPDAWNQPNWLNSCKVYPSETGKVEFDAHLARAQSWGQPMYIGEFDGFHLSYNKGACPYLSATDAASNDLKAMMAYAKLHYVNWSLWEYSRSESIVDSSGNPKQPLLGDLQSGL